MHADKCYVHNFEIRSLGTGCRFGDDCTRAHVRVPDKDFEPPRHGSQSPKRNKSTSSSDNDKTSVQKGRGRSASRGRKQTKVTHWFQFAKEGKCDVKDKGGKCKYPHLSREEVAKAGKARGPTS